MTTPSSTDDIALPVPSFGSGHTVAMAPCRDCRKPDSAEVSAEAKRSFDLSSRTLRGRGEKPLDWTETFRCPECIPVFERREQARAVESVRLLGALRRSSDRTAFLTTAPAWFVEDSANAAEIAIIMRRVAK